MFIQQRNVEEHDTSKNRSCRQIKIRLTMLKLKQICYHTGNWLGGGMENSHNMIFSCKTVIGPSSGRHDSHVGPMTETFHNIKSGNWRECVGMCQSQDLFSQYTAINSKGVQELPVIILAIKKSSNYNISYLPAGGPLCCFLGPWHLWGRLHSAPISAVSLAGRKHEGDLPREEVGLRHSLTHSP